MSTTRFNCELGFDWNLPDSLQAILVKEDTGEPIAFTELPRHEDIEMVFTLFDITPIGAESSSDITVKSLAFEMSFTNLATHLADAPLSPDTDYSWESGENPTPISSLSAFSDGSLSSFPIGPGAPQVFTCSENGSFNLAISVTVTDSNDVQMNFGTDPEMIVGGGNGGSPEDDSMKKPAARDAQPERPATSA